ncbi:MAG TPA: hypothetical protein VEA19_04220 [Actinomycetota bacterium]|nr:hypothetical protein [Actinomycetota bacterium]
MDRIAVPLRKLMLGLVLTLVASGMAPPASALPPPPEGAVRGSVPVGSDVVYYVTIRGPVDDATIQDTLPPGVVFSNVSTTHGTCLAGPPVTCSLGSVEAASAARIRIVASAVSAGAIQNDVQVTLTEGGTPSATTLSLTTVALGASCDVVGTQGADDLSPPGGVAAVICGIGGDDVIRSGPGSDRGVGGSGRDTFHLGSAPAGVRLSIATGSSNGHGADRFSGIESVVGSPNRDLLEGSDRGDTIFGGGGSDTLRGLRGSDALFGGADADTLVGGPDLDSLNGGAGRDACLEGSHPRIARKVSCEARAFATSGGVALFAPSLRPVGFGFHEALYWTAKKMRPQGRMRKNDNPRLKRRPRRTDGHRYLVMASRGRKKGPTTAIDIAAPRRVVSPVNGTVEWVRRYRLYCTQWDWAIAINPIERPDLRVLVLHLVRPTVGKGDVVAASVTPLGKLARNDGPHAQQNLYFPDRYPHVHIEVERKSDKNPRCAA